MAVRLHRGLHALVTEAFCNQQRRKAHLHQQTGVTVPNIVYANFLDAGFLSAALHFVRQEILRIWEYPIFFIKIIALANIRFEAFSQHVRHCHHTVAFRRFRCGNHVLPIDPLIRLVHRDRRFFKVEIRRCFRHRQGKYFHAAMQFVRFQNTGRKARHAAAVFTANRFHHDARGHGIRRKADPSGHPQF